MLQQKIGNSGMGRGWIILNSGIETCTYEKEINVCVSGAHIL